MSGTAPEDRTEDATPKRLQKAREEGRIEVSRELVGFAGLAGVTLAMVYTAPAAIQGMGRSLSLFLSRLDAPGLAGPEAFILAGTALLRGIAPFVLAAMVAGVLGVLAQTGFLLRPSALHPDLSRLSPAKGLKRLFGAEAGVEAIKSVAKLAVMGWAVWLILRGALPVLTALPFQDPRLLLSRAAGPVSKVLFAVLGVQAAVALLDVLWSRLQFHHQMRMSRQDILDEQREADGDPRIKARIRQIRQVRARRRMLAAVPKATVVITNPTHYAVALAYDRSNNAAPRVVAKGVDSMAARIREVAMANRVPLVANPPLARVLHLVELDTEIPAEHFKAVAEIIAYVFRLNQRVRR
jgi:flagellar biosynthetic protein FlhB